MRALFGEDDILSTRLKNDEKEPVLLVGVWTSTGQKSAAACSGSIAPDLRTLISA